MQNKVIILLSLFLSFSTFSFSQKEVRKQLKEGNKGYKQEKYTESEIAYRKALEANAQSADAAYNLGNALYKQGKFPEALQQYQAVISSETDAKKLASTFHNIGNIFMNQQDYSKSVGAYRMAMKNNPHDNETRYNLALAQKLLQQQQQNQDQDKDKNKDDKDQNKDQDKQDQDKKEQNQDKQDQQDKQDDKKQDKTQEQQQQNEQMSKDNAQQILDALLQDEKDTQEKVKEAQMRQIKSRKTDKEW